MTKKRKIPKHEKIKTPPSIRYDLDGQEFDRFPDGELRDNPYFKQ